MGGDRHALFLHIIIIIVLHHRQAAPTMPPCHLPSACEASSFRVVGGRRDPFIWQSRRGFHMLMHDHAPFAFHKQVLTYAFTDDREPPLLSLGSGLHSSQDASDTVADRDRAQRLALQLRAGNPQHHRSNPGSAFQKIPAMILWTGGERDGDSVR